MFGLEGTYLCIAGHWNRRSWQEGSRRLGGSLQRRGWDEVSQLLRAISLHIWFYQLMAREEIWEGGEASCVPTDCNQQAKAGIPASAANSITAICISSTGHQSPQHLQAMRIYEVLPAITTLI